MARDLDAAIEAILRALPAGSSLTTPALIKKLAPAFGQPGARLLKIAPNCPAAKKDMDNGFIRFGRTCYPWRWSRLEPGEPLILAADHAQVKAEGRNAFAAQVAAEVVDRLAALGYLPVKLELASRCAGCGKTGVPIGIEGFCQKCIGDIT